MVPSTGVRATLAQFFNSKRFEVGIAALILVNALLLGFETLPGAPAAFLAAAAWVNTLVLAVFVVELTLKVLVFRAQFFRSGWNWFDVFVVMVSLVPSAGAFAALRAIRAIRLLRLVTAVPSLRRVIEGFLHAIPGLGSVIAILVLLLFVFSLIATQLFGVEHPDYFGSLGASAFSLFTVMTLEGWPDLAREVMGTQPWAWAFFLVFIVTTSWTVLNLFIGVIVDSMQVHTREQEEVLERLILTRQEAILAELHAVRSRVDALADASTSKLSD